MLDILKFGVYSLMDLPEDSLECFNRSPKGHCLSQRLHHLLDKFDTSGTGWVAVPISEAPGESVLAIEVLRGRLSRPSSYRLSVVSLDSAALE